MNDSWLYATIQTVNLNLREKEKQVKTKLFLFKTLKGKTKWFWGKVEQKKLWYVNRFGGVSWTWVDESWA